MIWRDIVLDKNISKESIIEAFGLVLNLDGSKINLINALTDFKKNIC